MTSGGARVRPGPPPQRDALRRDRPSDQAEWVTLPLDGRAGDPPAWPLTRANRRELERWAIEWRKPQAVMWEALAQVDQVANYVRHFVEAEKPRAATPLRQLVKQEEEILGLSLTGLARNRWVLGTAPVARQEPAADEPEAPSARERLRLVSGA